MQFIVHVSNLILNSKEEALLVKEKKEQNYGKYNLPGGHLELGEDIAHGVIRETREEVNLRIEPKNFIGVFTGIGNHHFLNFIFYSELDDGIEPEAQKNEILDCEWVLVENILSMEDDKILNPDKLKLILKKYKRKELYPLSLISELGYGNNKDREEK